MKKVNFKSYIIYLHGFIIHIKYYNSLFNTQMITRLNRIELNFNLNIFKYLSRSNWSQVLIFVENKNPMLSASNGEYHYFREHYI